MPGQNENRVLAIVPAFNEQESIAEVVKRILATDRNLEVVVIDDGSFDRTVSIAQLSGAKVIRLSSHMGYGVAIQTGYKYAFQKGFGCVVQLDGDGQHDPVYLPDLIEPIRTGEADLVVGSRFLEKGKPATCEYAQSFTKKIGIKLFARLTSVLVGHKVTDPTSGYQAFSQQVIAFLVRDFFPDDYPDADVILVCHRAGFTIKEVPVIIRNRISGKSMHRGLRPAYYIFKMFLSIFMTMLRKKPPFLKYERAFHEKYTDKENQHPGLQVEKSLIRKKKCGRG